MIYTFRPLGIWTLHPDVAGNDEDFKRLSEAKRVLDADVANHGR